MAVGREAAARHGDDPPAMALLFERERRIDHRQAGAEDEERRIERRAAADRLRPWADKERVLVDHALMAAGENGEIGFEAAARDSSDDFDALRRLARRDRPIPHAGEGRPRSSPRRSRTRLSR